LLPCLRCFVASSNFDFDRRKKEKKIGGFDTWVLQIGWGAQKRSQNSFFVFCFFSKNSAIYAMETSRYAWARVRQLDTKDKKMAQRIVQLLRKK